MGTMSHELPVLSRPLVCSGAGIPPGVRLPTPALLTLPVKAVQFGTGAFLRGFVEYFIDRANQAGRFNGRVVAVDSTGSGRAARLNAQDGLYTLAVQGREGGEDVRSFEVLAALSRVIPARERWPDVLALARSTKLQVVFSNTTEAGIVLDEGDAPAALPPRSYPGKLTIFLLERARAFDYSPHVAPVVIPCELIEDNGTRLEAVIRELARRWSLGPRFRSWLGHVRFCNTLVDRIVPGTPDEEHLAQAAAELGYRDELLTVCEPYRLFAIEGNPALAERLGFAACAQGVVVTPDIAPFRERKLRLLNGAHTVLAPAALLCGCTTVLDAVQHELAGTLLRDVLLNEIPAVTAAPGAVAFAREVLERFSNPFVRHNLIDITLQQTTKFRVRVVPTLLRHAERHGEVPPGLTLGFAGLLHYLGNAPAPGTARPADEAGEVVRGLWRELGPSTWDEYRWFARTVCSRADVWGARLDTMGSFADTVGAKLHQAARGGFAQLLATRLAPAPR